MLSQFSIKIIKFIFIIKNIPILFFFLASSCPVNEELSNCTQKECRAQDCFDRYLSIPCPSIPEESCEKGCVCQWGYLRDKNNVCIPADECPGKEFNCFFLDYTCLIVPKPLQLPKTRNNSGDHQKIENIICRTDIDHCHPVRLRGEK